MIVPELSGTGVLQVDPGVWLAKTTSRPVAVFDFASEELGHYVAFVPVVVSSTGPRPPIVVIRAKQVKRKPALVVASPNRMQLWASFVTAFVGAVRPWVFPAKQRPRAKGGSTYSRRASDQSIPAIPFAHAPIIVSAKQRVKHVGFSTVMPNMPQQRASFVAVFVSAMRAIVIPGRQRPKQRSAVLFNPNKQQSQQAFMLMWVRAIVVTGRPVKRVAARVVIVRPLSASITAAFVSAVRPIIIRAQKRSSQHSTANLGPAKSILAAIISIFSPGGGGTGTQLEGRALDRYTDKYPYGSNKPAKREDPNG